ncbi:capsule assembly Wzi family protein [Candidatus Poribacteria bacterium]
MFVNIPVKIHLPAPTTVPLLFIVFLTFSLVITPTLPAIDAEIPLMTGEWAYFALWKLEANGITGPILASSRPFERDRIAQIVADIKEGIKDGRLDPSPLELDLINKLEAEFARDLSHVGLEARELLAGETDYRDEQWGEHSASMWVAVEFHPTPDIALYEEIDVGRGKERVGADGRTASQRTKTWRWDYTADFRRAYIRFHRKRFEALLGRQSLFWGPAYGGSLILSRNSPALDMALLTARFGPVKATAFSAVLDTKWSERGDPSRRYLADRYLSGHRLDWVVSNRLELGLSEVVLYGGEARNMELQYMNPLLPYYASQWNSDQDDNVLASADFAIRPIDRLKIYGEFLVDDFQYSRDEPNALGYIAGIYFSDPLRLSGTDLRAEYTRIDTRTYTHRIAENQFTHYGWIMGHRLGPDADQFLLELSRMINIDIRLKLMYTYERQGSRTVENGYVVKGLENIDFPSDPVERRHRFGLQFLWEPVRGPQLDISCGGVSIRGQHENTWEGELSIAAGFLSGVEWFRRNLWE